MHTKLHSLLYNHKQKDLGDKQAYSRRYRGNKRVIQAIPAEITIYEIDHCTASGPCTAPGRTPSSLLVCGEQKSRQRVETAREPRLPDHSRDPGNYIK